MNAFKLLERVVWHGREICERLEVTPDALLTEVAALIERHLVDRRLPQRLQGSGAVAVRCPVHDVRGNNTGKHTLGWAVAHLLPDSETVQVYDRQGDYRYTCHRSSVTMWFPGDKFQEDPNA